MNQNQTNQPNDELGDENKENAPGAGIDTDGDGNADKVVETPQVETHTDHPDDYKGKVKLSENMGDFMEKKDVTALVKSSLIREYFKKQIAKQIKIGKLEPIYAAAVKRIKSASDSGAIYRPGSDGL